MGKDSGLKENPLEKFGVLMQTKILLGLGFKDLILTQYGDGGEAGVASFVRPPFVGGSTSKGQVLLCVHIF